MNTGLLTRYRLLTHWNCHGNSLRCIVSARACRLSPFYPFPTRSFTFASSSSSAAVSRSSIVALEFCADVPQPVYSNSLMATLNARKGLRDASNVHDTSVSLRDLHSSGPTAANMSPFSTNGVSSRPFNLCCVTYATAAEARRRGEHRDPH